MTNSGGIIMWVTLSILCWTHTGPVYLAALLRSSVGIDLDTVPVPQTPRMWRARRFSEPGSACSLWVRMHTHTMGSPNFILSCSLIPWLVELCGDPSAMARHPLRRHVFPPYRARLHGMPEDRRGNTQCSHGEPHDCSVWVVQLVRLA